jgi:phosphoglycerate dehydrogenase-like enzyme
VKAEPKPEMTILMHPKVSLTPHIGAATEKPKIELEQNLLHKYQFISNHLNLQLLNKINNTLFL